MKSVTQAVKGVLPGLGLALGIWVGLAMAPPPASADEEAYWKDAQNHCPELCDSNKYNCPCLVE
jgi:hypothetical protein